MKLYSVYDKIGKKHLSITLAETDADFVRSSLFAILMDYPILDIEAYCVGDFYEDSGLVRPCVPRLVDWNCYRFPKNADSFDENYLSIDDIRKKALAKKQEFNEKLKDKKEDLLKLEADIKTALDNEKLSDKQRKDLEIYLFDVQAKINSFDEVA